MAISQVQFDMVGTKISACGAALGDLVMLYGKAKRRLDEGDFTLSLAQMEAELIDKYMQKRALLVAAVNDLPQVS
jgi:galactitol-specific phosphotransferase system IIB component